MPDLLNDQCTLRQSLLRRLQRDLVGPADPEETLEDRPITRYISGVLYPRSEDPVAPEQADTSEDYDDTTRPEPTVAQANARYPSSIALTFSVDASCESLVLDIEAARYREGREPDHPGWHRQALELEPVPLAMEDGVKRTVIADGLEFFCRVRPAADGRRSVTVAISNTFRGGGVERDEIAFFQPVIVARDARDGEPFRERDFLPVGTSDQDLRSYRLLYREARVFATGHGCSAEWESTGDRASLVRTTFVPKHEVPLAESNPAIELEVLGLGYLATAPKVDVLAGLRDLCEQYEAWIGARQIDAGELDDELRQIANEHLADCREASARMRRGIGAIESDDNAWTAFRLMNEAMLTQRSRAVWLAAGRPDAGPSADQSHRWRAFQLAFILLCLPGVAGDEDERLIADLLWFPTGGGKTEAYLGLIAFTLFLRRLRVTEGMGGGVTVIMRYTLRLLTLQQFERASLLICACESIRRREAILGDDEIQIGLWVGEAATPNYRRDARSALDRLRQGEELSEGNPIQVRSCPWCGTRLSHRNYFLGDRRQQLIVSCGEHACDFKERLPIVLIDEDVYDWRPSLIIATADKFAQLPWNDSCRALFNLGTPDAPPELIIQDELHLISGPLGTLAGLYETAVDLLCRAAGRPPKVIASTATIRRAQHQGKALFGRDMRQFPPPALDQGDSWFAVDAPSHRRGGRLYVGAMAPGTSHATLLIRAYAALLQGAQGEQTEDPVKDPYWTLVGYFNSLRVLAGARIQVQDDVRDRIGLIAGEEEPRDVQEIVELTSREPSSRIPQHLEHMATALPARQTIDVLLATNMISVGVDIDRLGLMVVMGQPQATAEYIQATSRVGRQHPGLVLTLFNSARSRDRSHYESFVPYHSALYRQVESSSVTPFSSRARERALHAVVVALARLLEPAFAGNDGAAAAAEHRDRLVAVRDQILMRVADVDDSEYEQTAQDLDDIIDFWVERAADCPKLCYSLPFEPERALLSRAVGVDPTGDEIPTLNSLRDVDQVSDIYLVR